MLDIWFKLSVIEFGFTDIFFFDFKNHMGAQEKKHKEQQKSLTTLSARDKNSQYFYLTVLILYSVVQHRGHNIMAFYYSFHILLA